MKTKIRLLQLSIYTISVYKNREHEQGVAHLRMNAYKLSAKHSAMNFDGSAGSILETFVILMKATRCRMSMEIIN